MNKLLVRATDGGKIKQLIDSIIAVVLINFVGSGAEALEFGEVISMITDIGSAIIVISFVAKIIPDRFKGLKLLMGGIGFIVIWPFDFIIRVIFFPFKKLRNIRIKFVFDLVSKYNSLGRIQKLVDDDNYSEELKETLEQSFDAFDATSRKTRGEEHMFKKVLDAISANKLTILGILSAIGVAAGDVMGGMEALDVSATSEYAIYGAIAAVLITAITGKGIEKPTVVNERKAMAANAKYEAKTAKDAEKSRITAVKATKAKLESNIAILKDKLIEAELNVELGLPNSLNVDVLRNKVEVMEAKLEQLNG